MKPREVRVPNVQNSGGYANLRALLEKLKSAFS